MWTEVRRRDLGGRRSGSPPPPPQQPVARSLAGNARRQFCRFSRIFAHRGPGLVETLRCWTADLIRVVHQRCGVAVVGIVVYGSWSRGELADTSDIDLLVVLDADVPITRRHYQKWDTAQVCWAARSVDVQLVHLPASGAEISGTWAEVATEGIILWERDCDVLRRLIEIRQRIAAEEIVRHSVSGQPYWVRRA